MGRRSRKRLSADSGVAASRGGSTRAERDAARRRRAAAAAREPRRTGGRAGRERPPAPWGSFPLTELTVLLGILFLIGAFLVRGERGKTMLAAGLVLGSLGGLELSIREHFGGFKSHTTMLSAACGILTIVVVTLVVHPIKLWIVALAALAVFATAFWSFHEAFKKRSGGVGFR